LIHGRAALLVIDLQRDFATQESSFYCPGCHEMLPGVVKLITACRTAGVPVIYTKEVHRAGGIDLGRERTPGEPEHCVLDTPGVELIEEVTPTPNDFVVSKPRYSAFLGTDLGFVLNGLGVRPGDTLIICGAATDVCVHYTAVDAHQRDYWIKIVEDCCAGTNPENHRSALALLEQRQVGSRTTLDKVLGELEIYAKGLKI